jgi:FkbM family methyltransferase
MSQEDKKKQEQSELDKLFDDLFKNTDNKSEEKSKSNDIDNDDFLKSLFSEEPKDKNRNDIEDNKKKEEKKDDDNFDWLKDLIDEIDKEENEKKKQETNAVVPAKPVKPSFTSKLKDKPRAPKPPEHIRMWGSGKKIVHMPEVENKNKAEKKYNYKLFKYFVVTVGLMVLSGMLGFFSSNYMSCSTKTDICKNADVILHKTYAGDKILIDTSLVNTNGKKIVEQGYIDAHISNLMYNFLKKGSKVVDVGAGFGYYTFYLARIVGNSGKVYAIEGRKNVFELLDASVRINKFENIETFNAVLFSDIMRVFVNLHDHKRKSSFGVNNIILQQDNIYNNNSGSVMTMTLDSMTKGITNISLLNINANGNELSIILGAKNLIANSPHIKIITTWSKYEMSQYVNIHNVVQQLISNGFKFWLIKPSSGKLVELTKVEDIMQVERGRFLIAKSLE